jgi:hypothetical protein
MNATVAQQLPTFLDIITQFFRFFLLNYQLIPVSLCVWGGRERDGCLAGCPGAGRGPALFW